MSSIFDIEILNQSRKLKVGCLAITESNKSTSSFEYDSGWMKIGYPIGADLPLNFGVHKVMPLRIPAAPRLLSRTSSFGFMCDSAPGAWVPALIDRAKFFGLKAGELSTRPELLWRHSGHPGDRFSAYSYQNSKLGILKKTTVSLERRTLSRLVRLMESFQGSLHRYVDADIALLVDCTTDIGGSSIKGLMSLTSSHETADWVVRCKSPDDLYSTPLWSAVTASIARGCGIQVPDFSYELCARFGAYLEKRFDRTAQGEPLAALSAATLCMRPTPYKALTAPIPSWLDVADILNREGSRPAEDLAELFRRLVFATYVNLPRLTLERIWFTRQDGGWRLAPMTAPCASPSVSGSPQLAIPLAGNDAASSIDKLERVSPYFNVPRSDVREIALSVARSVHEWRDKATSAGADLSEIAAMQSAFFN
jgi:serine/threonine-protein kinase HipA